MMNQDLVSIIVPVYKAEKYIHQCVDNILAQTYTNIEVILVDDGSPDNCGTICDKYAAKDNRVKVIHQQNGGVSAARNTGLVNASGEWITFVDADDKVTVEYIEKLKAKDGDWIIGGYCDTKNHVCHLIENSYAGKDRLILFFQEHLLRLYTNTIWGKLYRSSIIHKNHIEFNANIRFSEDFLFNMEFLSQCNTIALSNTANYIYTANLCMEEKYNLTLQELTNILNLIIERTQALSEKWGADLSCEKSIRVNIAMYPMSNVLSDSYAYENLYTRYVIGKKDSDFYERLYSDTICSPVIRGIRIAKMHLKTGHFCKAIDMIRKIRKAYGHIIPSIHFSRYDRIVSLFCRNYL